MIQEIALRRDYYSISVPSVAARILRLGRIVDPHLPEFVASALNVAQKVQRVQHLEAAKKLELIAQYTSHYRLLLNCQDGAELELSFHALSGLLSAIDQDTRLSISVGSVVMRSILKCGAKRMIWRPFEFAKCGMAMGSLFSFDVSVALHLQIEQERAALRTRTDLIDSAVAEFRDEVAVVIDSIANVTTQLSTACSAVDNATADTERRSGKAVNAITESTSILQMSSHAIEEMGASIRQIGDQAVLGANLATNAVRTADTSTAAMRELSGALGSIDTITQMISTIAGQTNLLALNATIEAARAGEAGRGFAVVASEVKGLVSQVERATDEIKKILANVRAAADSVIGGMGNIGEIISGLSGSTASVSVAVQQQRQAVEEICGHIDSVVNFNSKIKSGIGRLAASSSASAGEARMLNTLTDALHTRSNSLMHALDQLAQNLRAA